MNTGNGLNGCNWYASQMGWRLLRGNVMVEGNLDVRYFKWAAAVHEAVTGLSLLDKDLSVFSPGSGDLGGTFGIAERFPVLHGMARVDMDSNGKTRYRVIALLDDDHNGRAVARLMSQANRSLQENAQIFLLKRRMPRRSRDAKPLTQHLKDANAEFGTLDCVIEDLVDPTICDLYAEQFPQHVRVEPKISGGGRHLSWSEDGKFGLVRFVEQNAEYEEMQQIIEVLKSLRFYLGLSPDGVA
jgi:hypothetical protein